MAADEATGAEPIHEDAVKAEEAPATADDLEPEDDADVQGHVWRAQT